MALVARWAAVSWIAVAGPAAMCHRGHLCTIMQCDNEALLIVLLTSLGLSPLVYATLQPCSSVHSSDDLVTTKGPTSSCMNFYKFVFWYNQPQPIRE